ncbi:hypothetical protein SAMN05428942_7257 [Streptomyces sp. 2112.2]|uniref:hypothetical protein n=1 Tax=Streptomyces sp. 2112.2 TaxID=1881024 RepID=UPI00089B1F14|nr:hypothetical protein [Streptomyces sp. 2112.2]SEF16377.1 hypothetical protein SAMN05428942_7257 [Streptomyces sp. 2112.2]
MSTIPNRHPGPCVTCGTLVPAQAGTLSRTPHGRWNVHCPHHPPPAPTTEAPRQQRDDEPPPQPPAEVRYTGTETQCAALVEALKLTPHMQVMRVSDPAPRREEPGRYSVYAHVHIAPRLLAAIAREEDQQ